MSPRRQHILEGGRVRARMTLQELWWAYFALGGVASVAGVRSYLAGATTGLVPQDQYDILTQAINERLMERGAGAALPYWDELA